MENNQETGSGNRRIRNELKNHLHMAAWILVWSASWAGIGLGIRNGWLPTGAIAVGATLFQVAIGVGMMLSYRRFLRNADELQRKIQLDALAISIGVGLIGGAGYSLLQRSGIFADANVFKASVVMICVTYSIAVVLGEWRYS